MVEETSENPRCGFCQQDPVEVRVAFLDIGSVRHVVFHCGGCRSVLSVQAMAVQETPRGRVQVPGRMV